MKTATDLLLALRVLDVPGGGLDGLIETLGDCRALSLAEQDHLQAVVSAWREDGYPSMERWTREEIEAAKVEAERLREVWSEGV